MLGQVGCLGLEALQAFLCKLTLLREVSKLTTNRGNLDLPPYLPFLGKTQLQILSFLTSSILMITHTFTSWAVTERVLLRDE